MPHASSSSLSGLYSKIIQGVEEYRHQTDKKIQDLQLKNEKLTQRIKTELIKNKLLTKIVEQGLGIKIGTIYEEKDKELHIYDHEPVRLITHKKGGNVVTSPQSPAIAPTPTTAIDSIPEGDVLNSTDNTPVPEKKKIYRAVKNAKHEPEDDKEEQIKAIENSINEIVVENFEHSSPAEIYQKLNLLYKSVGESTTVSNALCAKIRTIHFNLLAKLNLSEYITSLTKHVSTLEEIFKKKMYDDNKTQKIVMKILSPLDMRLLFRNNYYDVAIDVDDITKFKVSLDINADHPKKHKAFDRINIAKQLSNYSLALCPLIDVLRRTLINPYGFQTIVYTQMGSSSDEDPFSFYLLKKIENGRRYWSVDYRLEEFSTDIANIVKTHSVFLFRKIYFDVFKDNMFRENWKDVCVALSQDCLQLWMNIQDVIHHKKFTKFLQGMIRENATIIPTENDKFDLQTDDKLHKQAFSSYTDKEDEENRIAISTLFDNIKHEEIDMF